LAIYYRKHVLAKEESCVQQRLLEIVDREKTGSMGGLGREKEGVKYFYYNVSLFSSFCMVYL